MCMMDEMVVLLTKVALFSYSILVSVFNDQ